MEQKSWGASAPRKGMNMCGVFGFVSNGRKRPDVRTLERIARVTERRGPHAFGFAWIDGAGRLRCYKQTGRISDSLGLLALAEDARMLVGHCRYATQGSPADNINNHPHPADGGWYVHNGVIADYERLVNDLDLAPVSACDSELLGLLIEGCAGTLIERCRQAVGALSGGARGEGRGASLYRSTLVFLGLWSRPARLIAIRSGNPLHVGRAAEGIYLGSLAEELPGAVQSVRDDSVVTWVHARKEHAHAL